MWVTDADGWEWWVPDGTQRIDDPPYPLTAREYLDDVNDWTSLAEALETAPQLDDTLEDQRATSKDMARAIHARDWEEFEWQAIWAAPKNWYMESYIYKAGGWHIRYRRGVAP